MGQRRSFRIKQGLDLPITGECQQVIAAARPVTQAAVDGTQLLRDGLGRIRPGPTGAASQEMLRDEVAHLAPGKPALA